MNAAESKPQTRDEVLADIRAARAELEAAFVGTSQEQMTGPVTPGGWSIKDHLAHIAAWQRRGLGVIDGNPPYVGLGIDAETFAKCQNVDEINDIIFQQHKDRPLGEVLADFRATQSLVETAIEEITDADLQRELDPEISPRYRSVLDLANHNFARHDRVHIEDIRALAKP